MSLNLELSQLAVHYVDRSSPGPVYAPSEQDVEALHPTIVEFLLELVSKVWNAEDRGSTRSAHFETDDHEGVGPSLAKQYVDTIIQAEDGFFSISKDLAQHLYEQSPGTASPGLLAVVRLVKPDDGAILVALLKIRHKDESFVRVLGEALTQLKVEQVNNMLLQDIQKGAIIPHPHRDDYDLKLIDKVADNEPAKYFAEGFLGCRTKKSDEHQVKKLLPELRRYAREKDLPVMSERLPRVIADLQARETNVTTRVITEVVQENEVFGPDFQPDDLETYINQESDLGPVDIPPGRFVGRGKTGRTRRKITYTFRDPRFRGMTIGGPPEVLENVLSIEGDTVTFFLQTTRDGFDVRYE
jgi:hypothetical protein